MSKSSSASEPRAASSSEMGVESLPAAVDLLVVRAGEAAMAGRKVKALESRTSRLNTFSLRSSTMCNSLADREAGGIDKSRLRVERSRSSRRLRSRRREVDSGMGCGGLEP